MIIDIPDGKQLVFPETRQVIYFDCGSNALASMLVYGGVEEREDRVGVLARTNKTGTGTKGVLRIFSYYGLLCGPPHNRPNVAQSVMWRPARVLRDLWGPLLYWTPHNLCSTGFVETP